MFPFLMPSELNLIRRDYSDLVKAPESNRITIRYSTWLNPSDSPQIDEVYGTDRREIDPNDVTVLKVPCVLKFVHARDLVLLAFGIVEEGDALFYFLDTVNLVEPVAGKPMVPGTLFFDDASGVTWAPFLDPGPMNKYLAMLLRDQGGEQVVAAKLKK